MPVLDRFNLIGKCALVTGATQGLGQAMAVGLAEAGADLILLDRQAFSETRSQIESMGRKCQALQVDLLQMSLSDAKEIIKKITQEQSLDVLVNNAGIIRRSPSHLTEEKDWINVLDINLNSVFYLSQAFGNYLLQKKRSGKIINMASMLSFQGGLQVASYTAAKSAIAGLTKALSNEWATHGINVNAIAPGYFKTSVTEGIYEDPVRNKTILDRIPAGEWGVPADLKGAVVFLASDASSYMNGTIVPVDGGWLGR